MNILEKYLSELKFRNTSELTLKVYSSTLTNFLTDSYGKIPETTEKIKAEDARKWLEIKDVRPSTYNSDLTRIRSFLNFYKISYDNNLLPFKKIKETDKKEREDYLTHEEVLTMIKNAPSLRIATEVAVLYSTGIRNSELRNLKHKNISHNPNALKGISRKGGKVTDVYFIEEIGYKKLQDYLILKASNNLLSGPEDYVFLTRYGEPLTSPSLHADIREAAKILGKSKAISPHTLRHSFTYRAVEKNVPLETISFQLSHSNIQLTHQTYSHYNQEIQKKRFIGIDKEEKKENGETNGFLFPQKKYEKCPKCNFDKIEEEFLICPVCDTKLKERCLQCGKVLDVKWKKCPYCELIRPEFL
jgi:integrase/recombinase XerD